jgi:tRNA(fMet)-specific endonuclease VapC
VAELLHGVHRAQGVHQRQQRQRKVEAVLSALQVLPYTTDIARVHAEIWAHLSERGQMIGAHDLIIAATALTHQLTLVTLNLRHFERVPGLAVVTFE